MIVRYSTLRNLEIPKFTLVHTSRTSSVKALVVQSRYNSRLLILRC